MNLSGKTIDLNADLGEGFGPYEFGGDEPLLGIVSTANIACGFHAGDPHIMRRTVERCLSAGVAIGAHPGLPDRLGFGRRAMNVSAAEVSDWILYQVGALKAFASSAGGKMQHVKPHGALYHMAATDERLAEAVVRAVRSLDESLLIYGPPKSLLQAEAERQSVRFVAEGFADRGYLSDGSLAPRGRPGAMIEAPAAAVAQALALALEGKVRSLDGPLISVPAGTICLHGDRPQAAERAKLVAEGLREAGVEIRSPG